MTRAGGAGGAPDAMAGHGGGKTAMGGSSGDVLGPGGADSVGGTGGGDGLAGRRSDAGLGGAGAGGADGRADTGGSSGRRADGGLVDASPDGVPDSAAGPDAGRLPDAIADVVPRSDVGAGEPGTATACQEPPDIFPWTTSWGLPHASKAVLACGIYVIGSSAVADAALLRAQQIVQVELRKGVSLADRAKRKPLGVTTSRVSKPRKLVGYAL